MIPFLLACTIVALPLIGFQLYQRQLLPPKKMIIIIAAAIAGAFYLAAGIFTYIVLALKFMGSNNGAYIEHLQSWSRSNVVLEAAIAIITVLLWPVHILLSIIFTAPPVP